MEWIELIEPTKEIIRLRYYPEQNSAVGEYGEVTYYRLDDTWTFDKLAKGYSTNYALHACTAAQRASKLSAGDIKKSGIIGWY